MRRVFRHLKLLRGWPSVLLIGSIPFLLMGVISMPHYQEVDVNKDRIIDVDVLIGKVSKLNQQRMHKEAIKMLMSALEQEKNDSMLRTLLLQSFDMFLEEQIRIGEQEIHENPKNSEPYLRVANSLELLQNNLKAMEVLVNGISLNPDSMDLWMGIALLEHKAGRDFEALDVLREVIRQNPKNSEAFNNAAFILARTKGCSKKDLIEAMAYAISARKLEPKNPAYIDTLAEVHFRDGNKEMATNLIKEAIKLAPDKEFYKVRLKHFNGDD